MVKSIKFKTDLEDQNFIIDMDKALKENNISNDEIIDIYSVQEDNIRIVEILYKKKGSLAHMEEQCLHKA